MFTSLLFYDIIKTQQENHSSVHFRKKGIGENYENYGNRTTDERLRRDEGAR